MRIRTGNKQVVKNTGEEKQLRKQVSEVQIIITGFLSSFVIVATIGLWYLDLVLHCYININPGIRPSIT